MRFSFITAAICALGAVKAQVTNTTQPEQGNNSTQNGGSQGGNTTIFQILNSTDGSSPGLQVAQFLQSSPDYQPIIDILNNPESNVTFFLPNDEALNAIMGLFNSSNNGTQGGSSSSVVNGPTGSVTTVASAGPTSVPIASPAARYIKIPLAKDEENIKNENAVERIFVGTESNFVMRALSGMKTKVMDSALVRRQQVGTGQNDTSSGQNGTSDQGNSSTQDNSTLNVYTTSPFVTQFTMLDLFYYHIVNQSITLPNSTAQSSTTDQSGNSTSTQNSTSQIIIYQTGPDAQNSTSQNMTTYILNTLLTNSTVDRLGNGGSPLVIQPSMNNTGNLTIGDGIGGADINSTITASNGMIYVIDKVLVPPVNTTDTLSIVPNATVFDVFLASSNVSGDALNNVLNVTIFVPINDALQGLDTENLSNDTINSILQAHIFPGTIYTSNITNGTTSATSYTGTNVTFEQNFENGTFSVNGSNIVQPNILTNTGVIHLINGVLNYTSPDSTNSNQGNSTETGTGGAFPAPTNTPSSSIISTNVPTLASLFFILTSTCFIFIYYV